MAEHIYKEKIIYEVSKALSNAEEYKENMTVKEYNERTGKNENRN